MSQPWGKYSSLKLNGILYSNMELQTLAAEKLNIPATPEWEKAIFSFIVLWLNDNEKVIVKTSGSTGKPKNILIEKNRMVVSAKATNAFFNLDENKTAFLCLSADFIAGKIMIVRAFVGGFDLHYAEPKSEALLELNEDFDFVAVVPMQLETVFKSNNILHLNRIKKMIIGGATLRSDLIAKLDFLEVNAWATYGMTETITHIALQGLNGEHKTDYFQALQGVEFHLDKRDCLRITAPAISAEAIQTNDRVNLINKYQFRFLGRVDFVVNSGGIKLSPEILEQKVATLTKLDLAFSSKKDEILGEKLVLVIIGERDKKEKLIELRKGLKLVLERFEQPKEILFVQEFPKTKNGKLDRIRLKEMIAEQIN